MGLHPWDLDRMTLEQVAQRLWWVKDQLKQLNSVGGEG